MNGAITRGRRKTVFLALLLWLMTLSPGALAQADPRLLCEGKAKLVFPRPEESTILPGWAKKSLITEARALNCTAHFPGDFSLYLTLAVSFRDAAAPDSVLKRFGAISALQGVR